AYVMTAPCRQRGRWIVGPVLASAADLVPLTGEHWTEVARARSVLVLGRYVTLTGVALPLDGIEAGAGAGKRRGSEPPGVAGIREYEPGDPLGSIDWMTTARTGQLMTRMYESQPPVQVSISVAVDGDADPATEEHEELLNVIATSLVVHLAGG